MLELIAICLVVAIGSGLTFFSGFGLGTLLLPVFALFFPVELAIALTAIVHFLGNMFKFVLVGKYAQKAIVLKFGVPAILFAFLGAWILTLIADIEPIYSYSLFGNKFFITPVKLIIALLLFIFSLFDIHPKLARLNFDQKYLWLGGIMSGFFGGLSGHQGALRSAFLIKANLSGEQFIATGVVIAVLIDISRLTVYSIDILNARNLDYTVLIASTLSAFVGVFLGNLYLKKITIRKLQLIVGIMLFFFSLLLGAGLV